MKALSPVLIQLLLAGVLLSAGSRLVHGSSRAEPPAPAMAAAGVISPAEAQAVPAVVRVDLVGLGTLVGAVASLVLACGKAGDMLIRAWRGDPPSPASG